MLSKVSIHHNSGQDKNDKVLRCTLPNEFVEQARKTLGYEDVYGTAVIEADGFLKIQLGTSGTFKVMVNNSVVKAGTDKCAVRIPRTRFPQILDEIRPVSVIECEQHDLTLVMYLPVGWVQKSDIKSRMEAIGQTETAVNRPSSTEKIRSLINQLNEAITEYTDGRVLISQNEAGVVGGSIERKVTINL